jgi:hypothetical protein
MKKTVVFNKENGLWYIDLPEYLQIFGENSKGNLLMVAGADTFLDEVCGGKDTVSVEISDEPFDIVDKDMLEAYNHPPVEFGGNYIIEELNHRMWLCPTTLFVFETTQYPKTIYFTVL